MGTAAAERLAEDANNEQTDTTLNPIKRNKSHIQSAKVQKVNGTSARGDGAVEVRDGPRFGNLHCNFSTFSFVAFAAPIHEYRFNLILIVEQ